MTKEFDYKNDSIVCDDTALNTDVNDLNKTLLKTVAY